MAQTTSQPPDPTTTLADPTYTLLNTSCLDFLLIELVPLAYRITADLVAQEEEQWTLPSTQNAPGDHKRITSGEADGAGGGGIGTDGGSTSVGAMEGSRTGAVTGGDGSRFGGGTTILDEDEAREAVFHRLDALGYRVGLGVVERVSRATPRPTTPLDAIKFLCKDLWTLLFRKQIDNLKTNHRGIFVLTDNTFKPLSRMSFDVRPPSSSSAHDTAAAAAAAAGGVVGTDANSLARVQPFLYFPAGLVRGCLAGLGIEATVTAESGALPAATFQIRTAGAKN